MQSSPPHLFIFGFGYTASYFARSCLSHHYQITGTTRDPQKYRNAHDLGYRLIDFSTSSVETYFKSATHVLISTPPSKESGDPVLAHFKTHFEQYRSQIQWLGYLSSTGVYGDHNGEWVDENAPSISPGPRAQRRLEAEQAWIAFADQQNLPLHIFRLAGIYGPYKNVLTRLSSGMKSSTYKEGQFFSRIHVEDIASLLFQSMQNPRQKLTIYNVADDEPAPSHIVDAYGASLLNLPAPPKVPFEKADLSPMAKEFYTHNRRVSNAKIKHDLAIKLNYPSYREGLTALYTDQAF